MTPIADMIREMTAVGVAMDVILIAVEAVEKASIPRNSTESAEEKRKRKDRERKRNSTEIPRNSTESTEIPNGASISKDLKKDSKRQNRGTRIAPDWTLTDGERSFAKLEGFSDWEIQREAQKFRDFWTACAGAKGVKLDWTATWRQWIRNGADRTGKRPAPSAPTSAEAAIGYYAKADSEQITAWDDYTRATTGKSLPRDRNFGWRVASEWPPDYPQPAREAAE
jgi:hypothetical protein